MKLPGAEVPQHGRKKQLNLRGSTVSLVKSQNKKFEPQTDFRFLKDLLGCCFRSSLKLLTIVLTSKLSQKHGCIASIRGRIFALPTCSLPSHVKGKM